MTSTTVVDMPESREEHGRLANALAELPDFHDRLEDLLRDISRAGMPLSWSKEASWLLRAGHRIGYFSDTQ